MKAEGVTSNEERLARRLSVLVLLLLALYGLFRLFLYFGLNHHPVYEHEDRVVATLKQLNSLQAKYSVENPDKGFTCQLALLFSVVPTEDPLWRNEIFVTGSLHDYRFAFRGCQPDADGKVTHYELAATPEKPGATGIRAFCTDQTGTLWYDVEGSAHTCLSARRPVY